jgi:lipoprotein NlpD
MIRSRSRTLGFAVLAIVLSACAGTTSYWEPSDYTVRSGDTLYSRYELDPADLARWNNLADGSVIRPGDRLHTRGPQASAYPASVTPAAPAVIVVTRGDTLYALAQKHNLDVKQLIQVNHLSQPYRLHPGQKLYTRSQQAKAPPSTVAQAIPASIASPEAVTVYPDVVRWSWPLKGKIVSRFNNRKGDAKGIDIAGREGEAVHAAAAGKVVYSGNGLISFGNLVIIKHNDAYLSAYAYNRKLLVNEGEQVKVGQVIAEIGKTDTSKAVLHFEIRKHGKPVDPLRHLPPG